MNEYWILKYKPIIGRHYSESWEIHKETGKQYPALYTTVKKAENVAKLKYPQQCSDEYGIKAVKIKIIEME